jgi:hypothetical protein
MQHDRYPTDLADLEHVTYELERTVVLRISDRMNHLLVSRVSDLNGLALFLLSTSLKEVGECIRKTIGLVL